jgi:hypothetical protein
MIGNPGEPIHFSKTIRYSIPGEPSLTLSSTCGELVDRLIGICCGRPEFLREHTCHRYLLLLPQFRAFTFSVLAGTNLQSCAVVTAEEPIRAIRRAMDEWVFSYFQKECHPILPSYALDLTQFIVRMIRGHLGSAWEDDRNFEVTPLVRIPEHEGTYNFEVEKRFKADFTRHNQLQHVICQVPKDGSVKFQEKTIIGAGDEFSFIVQRCHLSVGFDDYVHAVCEETPHLDMQSEFKFFGQIDHGSVRYRSLLPARWIMAALVWDNITSAEVRLPCP